MLQRAPPSFTSVLQGSSKRLNAHGLAAGEEKRLKPNIVHWTGLRWAAQALRRADVGAIGLGL